MYGMLVCDIGIVVLDVVGIVVCVKGFGVVFFD